MPHSLRSAALLVACAASAAGCRSGPDAWGYAGPDGPEHWAELSRDYALCATGHAQSPIDLEGATDAPPTLELLYRPGARPHIVHTAKTIRVDLPKGSGIRIGERRYKLQSLHFHTPAEHRIAGHVAPLEVHFVHEDDSGQIAIIAAMFELGAANPAIAMLWRHLPADRGDELVIAKRFDPGELIPADHARFYYEGSLTEPPCTEGVRWNVLRAPGEVSKAQLQRFREMVPPNARPLQPSNDRPIDG